MGNNPPEPPKETATQETMDFTETEKKWIDGKEYVLTNSFKSPLVFVTPVDPVDPDPNSEGGWVSYKIHYSVSAPTGNLKFKKITSETQELKNGTV